MWLESEQKIWDEVSIYERIGRIVTKVSETKTEKWYVDVMQQFEIQTLVNYYSSTIVRVLGTWAKYGYSTKLELSNHNWHFEESPLSMKAVWNRFPLLKAGCNDSYQPLKNSVAYKY